MEVALKEIQHDNIQIVKPWLIDKDNAQFLDPFFQNEDLRDEQLAFFLMRRDKRTFLIICDDIPVGIMGLTKIDEKNKSAEIWSCLLYTSPSPRDRTRSRMPSSA